MLSVILALLSMLPGVEVATIPVFLPGKFHGQMNLTGYSPWGHKKPETTEQLSTRKISNKVDISGHLEGTSKGDNALAPLCPPQNADMFRYGYSQPFFVGLIYMLEADTDGCFLASA